MTYTLFDFVDSSPVALSDVETFMSAYTTCRNRSHPIQTYKPRNTCGFLVGGDVETGVLYCVSLKVSIASFDTGLYVLYCNVSMGTLLGTQYWCRGNAKGAV